MILRERRFFLAKHKYVKSSGFIFCTLLFIKKKRKRKQAYIHAFIFQYNIILFFYTPDRKTGSSDDAKIFFNHTVSFNMHLDYYYNDIIILIPRGMRIAFFFFFLNSKNFRKYPQKRLNDSGY